MKTLASHAFKSEPPGLNMHMLTNLRLHMGSRY